MKLSRHVQNFCGTAAARWNVPPEVHPGDFTFQWLLQHPSFENSQGAVDYYFDDGAASAAKLRRLLLEELELEPALELLEFASGYGCVTRHLGREMPDCKILSCDIHRAAVDFLQSNMGVSAVVSATHPGKLSIDREFDTVFALSFFSHMNREPFSAWLERLSQLVKPGGFLVFTCHGRLSVPQLGNPTLSADGFYYRRESEQDDLDVDNYGSAITLPEFVFAQASRIPTFSLRYFSEGTWWEHQDLYVFRRQVEDAATQ